MKPATKRKECMYRKVFSNEESMTNELQNAAKAINNRLNTAETWASLVAHVAHSKLLFFFLKLTAQSVPLFPASDITIFMNS